MNQLSDISTQNAFAFAEIAIANVVQSTWTYHIPTFLRLRIQVGQRVYVPFGKGMQIGMVVGLHHQKPIDSSASIKTLSSILDEEPIVDQKLLQLILWMAEYYASSPGLSIQSALPSGMNFQAVPHLFISKNANPYGLSTKAQQLFDAVIESGSLARVQAEKRFKSVKLIDRMIKDRLLFEKPMPMLKLEEQKEWWVIPNGINLTDEWIDSAQSSAKKWIQFALSLCDPAIERRVEEVKDHPLYSSYCLKKALDVGILTKELRPISSFMQSSWDEQIPSRLKKLNEAQTEAFKTIKKSLNTRYGCYLLKGVTGSGKTEVYLHAIAEARKAGKSALILVPEIALTPQSLRRFREVFGQDVISLHSRQSPKERLSTWRAIQRGAYRIVLGPRSAVFAPLQDLGIIIVDEEHDGSYRQQDPEPRYHARDVAIMRANMLGIPIVLGSATPNIVSMQRATEGKFHLLELPSRFGEAQLPKVHLLDMKAYRSAMTGPLTAALRMAIQDRLNKKEQVILLLNRRGYGAYIQSSASGEIAECPNCSVSLTYHHKDRSARCHYCGYGEAFWRIAKRFGEEHTLIQGFGTQQVEQSLQKCFDGVRILRMDHDTTTAKQGHEMILNAFGKGEADILLGTQMVAKGLDFPNVTLVGILQADQELGFPQFNAAERSFQLLSQVSGRSGRAQKTGEVFIQSWQPEHPVFTFVQNHNYDAFYRAECIQRRTLFYPPYSKLVAWRLKGLNDNQTNIAANHLGQCIRELCSTFDLDIEWVLGPAPAIIYKQFNRFCWDLMIKLPNEWSSKRMHTFFKEGQNLFSSTYQDAQKNDLRLYMDVDLK